MKKKFLVMSALFLAICVMLTMSVRADDAVAKINDKDYTSLDAALEAAVAGDTIVLQKPVTITANSVNENQTEESGKGYVLAGKGQKNITLDLNKQTITSSNSKANTFVVKNGTEITIKNGTIEHSGTSEKDTLVVTGGKVILDNCKVVSKAEGTNKYGTGAGIRLDDNANVTVKGNSEVSAKYALWVYGSKNTLTVENSTVKGWAVLDISNGSKQAKSTENVVTIKNSTLEAEGIYSGKTDTYGAVVIGGQDGLKLNVHNSTIKSTVAADNTNPHDLFLFGNYYGASEDVEITVDGKSKLSTDGKNGSVIFDLEDTKNYTGNNTLYIANSVNVEGKAYQDLEGYVYVSIFDKTGNIDVIAVAEGSTVPDEYLKEKETAKGYKFVGWYKDSKYTTEFNKTDKVTEDTNLYPLFEKVVVKNDDQDDTPTMGVENVYVIAGVVALVTIAGAIILNKRK